MSTLQYIIKKYSINEKAGERFELPGGRGRGGLASLWQELEFKTGAEIGVESGRYSQTICRTNPAVALYCIDPWKKYPGYRDHVSQEHLDLLLKDAIKRTKPFNCKIIRKFSTEASDDFEDSSLDFVYIDANHDFENVTRDVTLWSKKVKPGGIISGHDYVHSKVGETNNTVEAVDAFVKENNINPFFVWVGDSSPSFMWIKP